MSDTQNCLHAVVRGRVQGVSFRYYTVERAQRLGLTGWVRNLRDGGVEVMAVGSRTALDDLMRFLKVGPPAARVDDVTVEWMAPPERFRHFDVRH